MKIQSIELCDSRLRNEFGVRELSASVVVLLPIVNPGHLNGGKFRFGLAGDIVTEGDDNKLLRRLAGRFDNPLQLRQNLRAALDLDEEAFAAGDRGERFGKGGNFLAGPLLTFPLACV